MLIRNATLFDGRGVDIRAGATIEAVAERLAGLPGEDTIDARGGAVLPGLHDHHVHLRAAAAAATSTRVGPAEAGSPEALGRLLAGASAGADGWVRAVGYHDAVAGPLDRHILDALHSDRPVRVQHRSGGLWILNSVALQQLGLDDRADGRFLRGEAELRLPGIEPSFESLGERFAAYGVTGVTDATPDQSRADIVALAAQARRAGLRQRLHCMAPAGTAKIPGVTLGPAKKILDDHTLDLEELTEWIQTTHAHGHPVAVHCVTDGQLVVTIAALRAAGGHPGDRIEHAAVVPEDCIADLTELGLTVVTQPNFIAERGDQYLTEVPQPEHELLWRVATLIDGGVRVALSTDTPFGAPDPWAAMAAAVRRRTPRGSILGAAERISPAIAMRMFLGRPDDPARPRQIAPGHPGDLCILNVAPEVALAELDAAAVAATVIGGAPVYLDGRVD